VSSWFVAVTKFRDRMVELNQGITWSPAHVRDGQFGKWLEGARDWCVSRNRYWGSPIPVWQSDNPDYPRTDVYGSLDELERDFGVRPTDLHRPAIDQLTRPNPDDPTGQSTMRRVPEVLDCWFDSGSMPFAQVHYPFENREWFEQHYPGDFIVEYIGQTRGWFYLLHVLATALFDRPSFKTCVTHGIVLGNDGTKMSKSRRNYPDVSEVFDRDGSDAMRWFLMSSPILHGGNLIVTEDGIRDAVRQVLLPLWNTWFFYALYSNAARGGEGLQGRRITAEDVPGLGEMDRYILARTRRLVSRLTELLDTFEIPDACEAVREYLDVLTNWYVRGSRDRFWKEDPAAFNTLYTVLETLCRAIAPLLPLITEEMWRGLTGGRSVHLCDYPAVGDGAADDQALPDAPELVAAMDRVRHVVSAALGLRKARGLRVRQPLSRLTVIDRAADRLAPFAPVIAGEVDVKAVDVVPLTEDAAARYGVREVLSVNARAAGPRLGRAVQGVIKAVKAGQWEVRDGQVVALTADGAVPLVEGEYTKRTEVEGASDAVAAAVLDAAGFVVLDTQLTPELEAEGYARDMVRLVQDARKAAGLHVTDRIKLRLEVPAAHVADVEANRELVCAETLTVDFDLVAAAGDDPVAHVAAVAGPASAADKN
jgi:isoleucyl-tRNA synthetase